MSRLIPLPAFVLPDFVDLHLRYCDANLSVGVEVCQACFGWVGGSTVGIHRLNVPAIGTFSHSVVLAQLHNCMCPLLGWGVPLSYVQPYVQVYRNIPVESQWLYLAAHIPSETRILLGGGGLPPATWSFPSLPRGHGVPSLSGPGGMFARRAPCARPARYFWTMFPPKSPQAHPLETPLELGDPNSETGPAQESCKLGYTVPLSLL